MFFNFHLESESGNNVCNSILVISFHRLQHRGQERNSCHYAEHYFIIEDVAVHRGFIDLKV